jgi:hypothetical protein
MKKRVLVIAMIILVILLTPRYNRTGHRVKSNHGHRVPSKKTHEETQDSELPFPGIWSGIRQVFPNRPGMQDALNPTFIATRA